LTSQLAESLWKLQALIANLRSLSVDEKEYDYLRAVTVFSPGMMSSFASKVSKASSLCILKRIQGLDIIC
jgi:hypothetical protein